MRTAPRSADVARDEPRSTAPVSSPPCEACAHSSQNSAHGATAADRRLGLARSVGAEHVEVHAGPQVPGVDDGLGARRDARDDVAGQRVLADAGLPAELVGQRPRRVGVGVGADAWPVAGGGQAARRPRAVDAAADDPAAARVLARQRLRRDRRDRAGAQRCYRARVEQRERLAGRRVADADRRPSRRQPARRVPGNDEIHLSIASPPPRAGMARKSPSGTSR